MDDRLNTTKQDKPSSKVAKRRGPAIGVACESCRSRKVKCDGQRPCSGCLHHSFSCVYHAGAGETHAQATKRKYEEAEEQRSLLFELIRDLAFQDDRTALTRLRALRAESDVDGVLSNYWHAAPALSSDRVAQHLLLTNLALSTANLENLVAFANEYAANPRSTLAADLGGVLNRIIQPEALVRLAQNGSIPRQLGSTEVLQTIAVGHDDPTYMVPVAQWTHLIKDDVVFSRLISTFINYANPYWRYIEEDLFLANLRSGQPGMFCSRFLVHAICSYACHLCEYPEAFVEPGNYITRGMQFHEEALRLWTAELGRPTLSNLQALTILAMDFGFRAKDKQTMSLISEAVRMNQQLPLEDTLGLSGYTSPYSRARMCIAWSIHHVETTSATGLLSVSNQIDTRLSVVPSFTDSDAPWSGKPYMRTVLSFRSNVLLRETCILTRLRSEMNKLLFTDRPSKTNRAFSQDIGVLVTRFTAWYENLPSDLRYSKDIILPLYDLFGDYYCAMLMLCSTLNPPSDDDPSQSVRSGNRDARDGSDYDPTIVARISALGDDYAVRIASLLRDFRETYSLKVTLPFIFQCEAYASFGLLHRIRRLDEADDSGELSSKRAEFGEAFEESLRCLLGTGTQMMMARGVARMVIRTAQDYGVKLPANVIAVLSAFGTWQAKDMAEISSSYPNMAIASDSKFRAEAQMEEVLRKWEDLRIEEEVEAGSAS